MYEYSSLCYVPLWMTIFLAIVFSSIKIVAQPAAAVSLPSTQMDREVEVTAQSEDVKLIKRLSCKITIDRVPHDSRTVPTGKVPGWANEWVKKNRFEFRQKHLHTFEEAFRHKGRNKGLEVQEMMVVRIIPIRLILVRSSAFSREEDDVG